MAETIQATPVVTTPVDPLADEEAKLLAKLAALRAERVVNTARDILTAGLKAKLPDVVKAVTDEAKFDLHKAGVGVWLYYAKETGSPMICLLSVGDDGLHPKAMKVHKATNGNGTPKAASNGNGNGNGNGKPAGVEYDAFLYDGRGPFPVGADYKTAYDAVFDALAVPKAERPNHNRPERWAGKWQARVLIVERGKRPTDQQFAEAKAKVASIKS